MIPIPPDTETSKSWGKVPWQSVCVINGCVFITGSSTTIISATSLVTSLHPLPLRFTTT